MDYFADAVTLHTEGVDRNAFNKGECFMYTLSPSTRRVWIEIILAALWTLKPESPSTRRVWIEIARLALFQRAVVPSPSTRRVWIEIVSARRFSAGCPVTLHTEGVDRNHKVVSDFLAELRHPPHGGCG